MGRFGRFHDIVVPPKNDTKDAARDPGVDAHEQHNLWLSTQWTRRCQRCLIRLAQR